MRAGRGESAGEEGGRGKREGEDGGRRKQKQEARCSGRAKALRTWL